MGLKAYFQKMLAAEGRLSRRERISQIIEESADVSLTWLTMGDVLLIARADRGADISDRDLSSLEDRLAALTGRRKPA